MFLCAGAHTYNEEEAINLRERARGGGTMGRVEGRKEKAKNDAITFYIEKIKIIKKEKSTPKCINYKMIFNYHTVFNLFSIFVTVY